MSFPIVHSLAGCAVYQVSGNKQKSWKKALFYVFLANAADLDFLPGILVGKPLLFHHTVTHSFAAALTCGLVVGLFAKILRKGGFLKASFLAIVAYGSHLVVDLLGPDSLSLLWPLQSADLAERFEKFRSLPVHCGGLKDFVCGPLLSVGCVRRFWREVCCMFAVLVFYFVRAGFRYLSSVLRRPPALTPDPSY